MIKSNTGGIKNTIIIPETNSEIVAFAANELKRYLLEVEPNAVIKDLENNSEVTIQPIYHLVVKGNSDEDGFSISASDNNIFLSGFNERSLLFAVYTYLEKYVGLSWPHVGEDVWPRKVALRPVCREEEFRPDFYDRGLNLETGFTEEDMVNFIDWMAKNRMNNVAIPFDRWDNFKDVISTEILKRGMKLALSGHSYFRFLSKENYYKNHPEWYALVDGERQAKGQLCFSNQEALQTLYQNVLNYLKEQPPVARLSIWPADNRQLCECEKCAKATFMENYCCFTSELKNFLTDNGYAIEVDHLAYNAALSDTMLQAPTDVKSHCNIDTQLAFWGRDYSHSLESSPIETDKEAKVNIINWAKLRQENSQGLYILEYYTDYWMLTSLYPPLTNVISADMRFYKDINVRGVYSLCVGCTYGAFKGKNYPWQWRQGLNMYLFAKCSWDSALDVTVLCNNYFRDYYGKYADEAREIFKILEESLPLLTSCNIPLFRLRFTDIWQRDETPEDGGVLFVPKDWQPDQLPNKHEERRRTLCWESEAKLAGHILEREVNNESIYYFRYLKVLKYFEFCRNKLTSLKCQLEAQQTIREGDNINAVQCLKTALTLQHTLYNENKENCNKWLDTMSGSKKNNK